MNRNRSRSGSRGVTPIAAALAALVLGAGVSGVWWLESASTRRDEATSSRADASEILNAATAFRAQHADGCPTLSLLEEERLLNRSAREDDAWGNRFRVRCESDQLAVISAGPDGKSNTADDIRVPH